MLQSGLSIILQSAVKIMSELKLSKKDLKFIGEKSIRLEALENQIQNFRKGFSPIFLEAAATPGNGIICLSGEETDHYAGIFEKAIHDLKVIKFVPASGAASRMFKNLFEFVNESDPGSFDLDRHPAVNEFIQGLDKLALTSDLQEVLLSRGKDLESLVSGNEYREIVEAVLLEGGLNYAQLPKGLIRFHRYGQENRTSAEEHLVEGAAYCNGKDGVVRIHYTVSDEHLDRFIDLLDQKKSGYEERFKVSYQIDFSIQRSFTDTIAVDMENNPFRDVNGKLLFRPGGHGALLTNLNELDGDLVFIKNIDNIAPDRMKPVTFLYKKALAGILLDYQQRAFELLKKIDRGEGNESLLDEAGLILRGQLNKPQQNDKGSNKSLEKRLENVRSKLDRPFRVCGMVKNEGEPGGGPFWTRNRDGSVSLQVVETSQVDFNDPGQAEIVKSATHFNPVDLVCATKNYRGEPFDLHKFVDPETGFISVKSQDGRSLKAQELPGLWNGAMADWNTLFVEVPIETFNPVKTINDLLRPQHIT